MNTRKVAVGMGVVAIALESLVVIAALTGSPQGTSTTRSSTSSSESTERTVFVAGSPIGTPSGIQGLKCPSGCVIEPEWGGGYYPPYQTLAGLVNAAQYVFVGRVASEWTVSVGTAPVTLYNVTVITALKISTPGGFIPGAGDYVQVGALGGTAANNTMSLQGYPTLSVGATYVFFVSASYNGYADAPFEDALNLSFANAVVEMTQSGPQGLFYVQDGKVHSLDNAYPQADSWIPTKVSGVPLSQFVQ